MACRKLIRTKSSYFSPRCVHIVLLFAFISLWGAPSLAAQLDDYVSAKDDVYGWKVVTTQPLPGGLRVLQVEVTSQRWQDIVWRHRLFVVVPPELADSDAGLLFISGSGSGQEEVLAMAELAKRLQVPAAALMDIPNQPLFHGLREDALIAHTFVQYVETGDEDWPLLLPMVKGAVASLDAFQAVMKEHFDHEVGRFVVSGASKRGWTTWLTAAVDDRVVGIAPMVYNNLNLPAQMELHARTFPGGASPKIRDYTERGIIEMITTDAGKSLVAIVDPYAYIDRLTVPKLLLHGTNDPYWPVDALNVYFDDLPGETRVVNFPNGGHDLGGDIPAIIVAIQWFFEHVVDGRSLPGITWETEESADGLTVRVQQTDWAEDARMWISLSRTRDFTNAAWQSVEPKVDGNDWVGQAKSISDYYIAVFMSVAHPVAGGGQAWISTPIFLLEP